MSELDGERDKLDATSHELSAQRMAPEVRLSERRNNECKQKLCQERYLLCGIMLVFILIILMVVLLLVWRRSIKQNRQQFMLIIEQQINQEMLENKKNRIQLEEHIRQTQDYPKSLNFLIKNSREIWEHLGKLNDKIQNVNNKIDSLQANSDLEQRHSVQISAMREEIQKLKERLLKMENNGEQQVEDIITLNQSKQKQQFEAKQQAQVSLKEQTQREQHPTINPHKSDQPNPQFQTNDKQASIQFAHQDQASTQGEQNSHTISQSAEENRPKRIYSQELKEISAAKYKQQPGMIPTPHGHVSLIDPLFKNSKDQTIDDIIFTKEKEKRARIEYNNRKVNYINKHKMRGIHLAKYNLITNSSINEQQRIDEEAEYTRLNSVYHFDKFSQELPICVIVPSHNNSADSRFEYSLNSIFTQNYTNYFVVIINDASTDDSDFMYRSYLNFHQVPPQRYAYIQNKVRKTVLPNIYEAQYNYCSEDSIAVVVQGSDELIGKNVLKTYNAAYQHLKGGVLYSNHYIFSINRRLEAGEAKEYSLETKTGLSFRMDPSRLSHSLSHKTSLFRSIKAPVLEDSNDNFLKDSYEFAMYTPLMEKACGRVFFIDEMFYLYNVGADTSHRQDEGGQSDVIADVRNRSREECLPEYQLVPFINI